MEEISLELILKIRNHINRTEKQSLLLEDLDKWCRVTASLDVLEDAKGAVDYYSCTPYPNEANGKYLFTYGLLQAFFMLEDAINSISISLFDREIDFATDYPDAYAVREIRNDILHSTHRGKGYYIRLAQILLSKDGFYYVKESGKDGSYDIIDVNVRSSINDVSACINSVLFSANEKLQKEFAAYIKKHKDRKMTDIFNHLAYSKEKVLLETGSHIGQWEYSATKRMVEKCEEELFLRYGSVEAVDSYKYLLEEIHEIYSLIDNGLTQIPDTLRPEFEKYMLQLLFVKLEQLKSYCVETDEYFENYGKVTILQDEAANETFFSNNGPDDLIE